jgi:hypothetical protein
VVGDKSQGEVVGDNELGEVLWLIVDDERPPLGPMAKLYT